MVSGLAVVTFSGVSAFAESRPQRETGVKRSSDSAERRNTLRSRVRGESSERRAQVERRAPRPEGQRSSIDRRPVRQERARVESQRSDRRRQEISRDRDRANGYRGRRDDDRNDRRRQEVSRNRERNNVYRDRRHDDRRRDSYRRDNRSSHRHRQPYYAKGKVSRINPYRGGYRVWVAGSPYPFFIPASHWHRDRFRVGVVINIGGFYNPLGYYDYYDGRATSAGYLSGVVESVDYRRDTFVLRNDATGSYVTVVMRDRRDRVRPGDYVEMEGVWSRSGVFQARRVEYIDYYGR